VPGKVPLYRESDTVVIGEETETVVGLDISDGRRRVVYIPGCARITPKLRDRLQGADVLFFDGTTFTDDEMPRLGLSSKTSSRMGHIAITGEGGSLHGFDGVEIARRIYIHINNSNPILIEDSAERHTVVAAGWDVAHDGMELSFDPSDP
jgi:pyrroloquinoline quinone biosynthesis protein B